jgi:ubiquinone/menaquinone biosynthesis C-methylase UbiE
VRDFWNRNVCQVSFIKTPEIGSRAFFEESEALRYRYHYHLLPLFDQLAQQYPGGQLLEVGCSMGTDLLQLARRGFSVTGIDLTETGIELAKQRFALYGYAADLRVGDAEKLMFKDGTFEVVYSFGVLHHTPDTEKAVREVWRVVREGGTAVVMLYHRHSLNYIAHQLLAIPADGSRSDPVPIARTYSRGGARELFAQFSEVHVDVDYLFGTGWGVVNRLMPASLHRFLGRHIGWHLMIRAVK